MVWEIDINLAINEIVVLTFSQNISIKLDSGSSLVNPIVYDSVFSDYGLRNRTAIGRFMSCKE